MLIAVGEQIILVEVEGAGDYANCSAVLDAETTKVLAKGCFFNTDREVELQPDANGKIAVADNILQIDPVDPSLRIVQRGGFLYDLDNQTDVFTAPVTVTRILNFTFEQCPFTVQREVVARAAMTYQRGYVGSPQLDAFAKEERLEATADAQDAESDSDDYNILDNPDLAYLRRQTYRRGI
ncbi:hypothetical protein J2788_005011 [Variovorax paradoxus]|nr:hypothetical protein [Variovorax paradoxus]